MKLFVSGPSHYTEVLAHELRALGHEVVHRPPPRIDVSCLEPLDEEERGRLADDVLKARGARNDVPLRLSVQGTPVDTPLLALAGKR